MHNFLLVIGGRFVDDFKMGAFDSVGLATSSRASHFTLSDSERC